MCWQPKLPLVDLSDRLDLDPDAASAVAEYFQSATYEGHDYHFLPDYRRQLERGTVIIADTAVRGFPKVPRTLVLDGGLQRHFDGSVHIEEKLNGYNARFASIEGRIYGFLRSGRICPFTTWVGRDRLDLGPVFEAEPAAVVCGELIGPDNPYTPQAYPGVDSIAFRAFDVRHRESGEPWPVERRRALLADAGVKQVRHLGHEPVDTAHEAVATIIDELDADGREGVVLKSPDGTDQLKYTTSAANCGDLAFAFSLPFDYGRDFVFRRIIREAFQSVEFDTAPERQARAADLGSAILTSMTDAIEAVDAGEVLGESHAVRAPPAVVEALFDHFESMGLRLEVLEDETDGEWRHVRFRKVVRSSTDKIDHYLDGAIVRE